MWFVVLSRACAIGQATIFIILARHVHPRHRGRPGHTLLDENTVGTASHHVTSQLPTGIFPSRSHSCRGVWYFIHARRRGRNTGLTGPGAWLPEFAVPDSKDTTGRQNSRLRLFGMFGKRFNSFGPRKNARTASVAESALRTERECTRADTI
ncbi:hypothetical protein F4780DRAFT_100679 [Xylariomycetidae sp. FL0641]|nr:hypothetical protein F4780DRAFT_100679 [Xylariomycetidae sp. FL0641]